MWFYIGPCGDGHGAVSNALDFQCEREAWAAIAAAEAIEVGARDVEASGSVVAGEAGRVDPAGEGGFLFPRATAAARFWATHSGLFLIASEGNLKPMLSDGLKPSGPARRAPHRELQ